MTKNRVMYLILFLFLGGTTAGCWGCFRSDDDTSSQTEMSDEDDQGGEDNDGDEDDAAEDLGDALDQAQDALQQVFGGGEGGTVKEAVDFRKLKDLLPDEVAGLERTNAEGERTAVMGMHFSNAKGEYEEDDERIEISISDLGTLTGLARMGYTAWLQTEIDRESDSGFERTRKFRTGGNEYPSFEKFESSDGDTGHCEIQVWAAERFIVEIKGRNVEMEQCEDARDEIPYRQLDRMKNVGTEEG